MKVFRLKKILLVEPIIHFKDTTIYAFDPSKTVISEYKNKLQVVEAIEDQRGW